MIREELLQQRGDHFAILVLLAHGLILDCVMCSFEKGQQRSVDVLWIPISLLSHCISRGMRNMYSRFFKVKLVASQLLNSLRLALPFFALTS